MARTSGSEGRLQKCAWQEHEAEKGLQHLSWSGKTGWQVGLEMRPSTIGRNLSPRWIAKSLVRGKLRLDCKEP